MNSILDTGTSTDTDQQLYSECIVFINKIKQARHSKTLLRHANKFNKLKLKQSQGGICIHDRQFNNNNRTPTHSNYNNMNDNNHNTSMSDFTKKWVVNLSSTPLTEAQTSLLAWGPNLPLYHDTPKGRLHISSRRGLSLISTQGSTRA